MLIFYDTLIVVLFIAILMIAFFVIEKMVDKFAFFRSRNKVLLTNLAHGLLSGMVIFFMQLTAEKLLDSFNMPLFIIGAPLILIFRNIYSSIISAIPSFLFILISRSIDANAYVYQGILVFDLFAILIIKEFVKESNFSFYLLSLQLTLWVFTVLFGTFYLTSWDYEYVIRTYSTSTIYVFLGFVIMKLIQNTLSSSQFLRDSSRFYEGKYLRYVVLENEFNKFVLDNNVEKGVFCLFSIKYNKLEERKIPEELNINIEKIFAGNIERKIGGKGILFNAPGELRGLFLPYKTIGEKDDVLELLNSIFKNMESKFKWDLNKDGIDVDSKIAMSFYGKDSSSVRELISFTNFAYFQQYSTEKVVYFNHKIWKDNIKLASMLTKLDRFIHLEDYDVQFKPLVNIEGEDKEIAKYSTIFAKGETLYFKSVQELARAHQFGTTMYRYFSAMAIKKLEGNAIAFHYPIGIFAKEFSIKQFINHLERFSLDPSNVYIFVNHLKAKYDIPNRDLKRIILELQNKGINFVLKNDIKKTMIKKYFDTYKYVYGSMEELDALSKIKNAKRVIIDITNKKEYSAAKKENIEILSGSYF